MLQKFYDNGVSPQIYLRPSTYFESGMRPWSKYEIMGKFAGEVITGS